MSRRFTLSSSRTIHAPVYLLSAMFRIFICVLLLPYFGTQAILLAQNATQQSANLQIIVVDSSTQADRVLQRLKNGEDFAALAKELSIDPAASDGGSMGHIDPAALRPELRDAVARLSVGEISPIIHTHSGYAILKMVSPAAAAPLQNTAPARILPSSATGAIRYAPNVGGKGEADLAFRNFPKPDGWSQNLHLMCDIRKQSLSSVIDTVLKSLDPANPDGVANGRPLDQIQMHYALANLYAYEGQMDKSIEQWQTAYEIAIAQLQGAMPEREEA